MPEQRLALGMEQRTQQPLDPPPADAPDGSGGPASTSASGWDGSGHVVSRSVGEGDAHHVVGPERGGSTARATRP